MAWVPVRRRQSLNAMTVSTTFGHDAQQDRIWLRCSAWTEPLWLTRRLTLATIDLLVQVLQAPPPSEVTQGALDAAAAAATAGVQRAAAQHGQALNRMAPGETLVPLSTGRERLPAAALQLAALATRCHVRRHGARFVLLFERAHAAPQSLSLGASGLHRWLHALHMMAAQAGWLAAHPVADWLTRSYLPPALASLLTPPAVGQAPGDPGDEAGPAPHAD